ncbi:MAG: DUF3327 domain-containing protein [Ilumatobacteraceae bacterium]
MISPTRPPEIAAITGISTAAQRERAAAALWAARAGRGPIVTAGPRPGTRTVTFLDRRDGGDGRGPVVWIAALVDDVVDDLGSWRLRRVADTSLWHLVLVLPDGLITGYRYLDAVADDAASTLDGLRVLADAGRRDPSNSESSPAGFGSPVVESVLTLPGAPRHPAWPPARREPPVGSRPSGTTVVGLGPGERAWITPAPGAARGQLVLFDGAHWQQMDVATALAGLRPDLSVVAIDADDRSCLATRTGAIDLARRAIAAASPHLGSVPPAGRIVAGQSYGALAALNVALYGGGIARQAIAQSPSLWFREDDPDGREFDDDGSLLRHVLADPHLGARTSIQVHVGALESTMTTQAARLTDLLAVRGAPAELTTVVGGHDLAWCPHLLLRALDNA